jgi:glycosyltransferase involved in cell wall biosynthesis
VNKISAIIHANNDERRLGRALETLRSCDEVIVVDHGSTDRTREVAREYGAKVRQGVVGVKHGAYISELKNDWVLCLLPSESLSEALEASLFEWKQNGSGSDDQQVGYRIAVREEAESGWKTHPAVLRLVNRSRINWAEELPPKDGDGPTMPGEILRFSQP